MPLPLDRIQGCDPHQCLLDDRIGLCLVQVEILLSRMSEATQLSDTITEERLMATEAIGHSLAEQSPVPHRGHRHHRSCHN